MLLSLIEVLFVLLFEGVEFLFDDVLVEFQIMIVVDGMVSEVQVLILLREDVDVLVMEVVQ